MQKTKNLILTFLMMACLGAKAQNTINTCSHSVSINGIKFDFSIGEMTLVSTERNPNLIVTQGFLQPLVDAKYSNPAQTTLSDFTSTLKVYPNPTSDVLFIESPTDFNSAFNFRVMDASGKTIFSKDQAKEISPVKWQINLSEVAIGFYFILLQNGEQVASFKIQKTK